MSGYGLTFFIPTTHKQNNNIIIDEMFMLLANSTKNFNSSPRSKVIKRIKYVCDFSSTTSFNEDKIMTPFEYLKELKRELKEDQKVCSRL